MHIESIANIGKSLSIKREKGADDTEVVIAHLKFAGLIVERAIVDTLIGQPAGWAQRSLYDELGAPIARMSIALHKLELSVSGAIKGIAETGERLMLQDANLGDIVITLATNSATIAGSLSWEAAGDEVADAEPLIGNDCMVNWVMTAGGQQDLLKAA